MDVVCVACVLINYSSLMRAIHVVFVSRSKIASCQQMLFSLEDKGGLEEL